MSLPRIFVHMPSYRDRECQWTIRDLFEKARHPERIFVGVCWQTVPEEIADCFAIETRPAQVRTVHFHVKDARGVCWAREQARTLWRGEEFSLQIDSHMRFVPHWDEKMLEMLALCESPDPVLTGYPPGYLPPDQLEQGKRPSVQCFKGFAATGIPEVSAFPLPEHVNAMRPVPTAACAAGFLFGSSRIVQDVPFDPEIYFLGEEPSLALRLWTHGFDLFSPHETVIYHYYKRSEGFRQWNDSARWNELEKRSQRRLKALFEPASCAPEEIAALDVHGLGLRRSLAEYEMFSGLSFAGKTLASYAREYPFVRQQANASLAEDSSLVPAPGLHLFILGEEGVLFAEPSGEFYRLNSAATFVWCLLDDGVTWADIRPQFSAWRGISEDAGARELAQLAAHWLGQGVLLHQGTLSPPQQPMDADLVERPPLVPRFSPEFFEFRARHYRLLGVIFCVRYSDPELEQWVHPVLAHLEVATATPAHTLTLARIAEFCYLFCDNEYVHFGRQVSEFAPHAKFVLLDRAIKRQNHLLHLHAGAVARNDRLVVLPAKSGSGKTSLTARLVAAGCEYFSDEVVLLERDTDRVRPVPIALCVKNSGLELLGRYFPGLEELPVHDRQDKLSVRYVPPPPSSLPAENRTAVAGIVIFPRYVPGSATILQSMTAADALGRLLDECVAIPQRLNLEDATALVSLVEQMKCFTLVNGNLDSAAEAVLTLLAQAGPNHPEDEVAQSASAN